MASLLEEIADLTEIIGEEAYKATAYRRAAQSVAKLGADIRQYSQEGRLREIPGVGPAIAGKIEEILKTGSCRHLEKLRARVPRSVLGLLKVPGLGPKTVSLLWNQARVASLVDLEEALSGDRLKRIRGIGDKKIAMLKAALGKYRLLSERTRTLLAMALPVAEDIRERVMAIPGIHRVEIAGSLRRGAETVGDIDIVLSADDVQTATKRIGELQCVTSASVMRDGMLKASIASQIDAEFLIVQPCEFIRAWHKMTGSEVHLAQLREMEQEQPDGYIRSEREIYEALGLPYIPPELREGRGEIEAARTNTLPALVEARDIKGDLHTHSNWSDGTATLEQMAARAKELGYEYLAITDHSVSLGVAHGLDVNRLMEQIRTIKQFNEAHKDFRILSGIEVDIKKDGSLDLPDEVLEQLDIVVASVHSGFSMPGEAMTRRMEAAIENPHVDIIGHPTGRLLGHREASNIDIGALLKKAAERHCAMEINSSPDRLDLKDVHARQAVEMGVKVAINTDAHGLAGLNDMILGIYTARRGWVSRKDVLNCMSLDELLEWLAEKHR